MRSNFKLAAAALAAVLLAPAADAGWFRDCRERRQEARQDRQCQPARAVAVNYAPRHAAPPPGVVTVTTLPHPTGQFPAAQAVPSGAFIAAPATPVPTQSAPVFAAPAFYSRPSYSGGCSGNRCGG